MYTPVLCVYTGRQLAHMLQCHLASFATGLPLPALAAMSGSWSEVLASLLLSCGRDLAQHGLR